MKVALLDDYQRLARTMAAWDRLDAEVTAFDHHLGGPDDVVAALEPFDVVVAMRERTAFPGDVLRRLPNLRLLVTTGPANAVVDTDALAELGITFAGTGGVSGNAPTVEMTWALVLAVARHVPEEDRRVRDGGWQRTIGRDLAGRRLGVVGLGGIGKPVAAVGKAFGMDVVAWSRHLDPDDARAAGVTPVAKEELFATSDVVTVHMKLSEGSRGLIGRAELDLMTAGAILVNTSRGPIVDEDALLAALTEGRIGGAGLDVYGTEPLPVDSPWRSAPNTVLTPHLGYVTSETYAEMYADAVADIEEWAAGRPVPRHIAGPEAATSR
ncbi:D-2-hydroxyacid dehydrogenase family protein [Actinomycetospora soli]|uniref:D-2-hydroxyacid dehydrogenase family protein n=1 Tax=Actinomycetospora soli TaxID=2893887 RepID=UPI001E4E3583|nr:D-2-hydroxyacid dehydrogenase family protein [Actinomycetospora soli]MCD2190647.1 D-2-hydroxyacid dehydrogenase family protein [Actinomycetospora soli]